MILRKYFERTSRGVKVRFTNQTLETNCRPASPLDAEL